MSFTLTRRVREIQPSATMALAQKAQEMQSEGRSVISLTAGEPDFDTPAAIVQAAHQAMLDGFTHYTGAGGDPELREAIAARLASEGVPLDDPGHVIPTPGAKQALFYAFMTLVEEGDGVLVLEPGWVSYRELVGLAGGKYLGVPLDPESGFGFDPDRVRRAAKAGGGARLLVVNSPSNPTGHVMGKAEQDTLAELVCELNLGVICDEIYGQLTYGEHKFRRLAAHPGLRGRIVTVDGFSKAYAMTGWRLGYAVGPSPVVAAMRKLQSHTATCPAAFVQRAGVAALQEAGVMVDEFRRTLDERRQLVEEAFGALPGIRVPPVQGAFYAFLDVRGLGDGDDEKICARFLEEAEVALIPGSAFGEGGRGFLRLSFASPSDDLREAARRIGGILEA